MSQDSSSSSKPGKVSPPKDDPEVKAKPERRKFSAEYKRRILTGGRFLKAKSEQPRLVHSISYSNVAVMRNTSTSRSTSGV